MINGPNPFQLPASTAPTQPDLADVLNLFQKQILLGLNSHHVGTIQSFDPATQTAQISINYKKTIYAYDGKAQAIVSVLEDYAPLIDVPVLFLKGGLARLTLPVAQGDECLLLFNDRDIDNWWAGIQSNGQPATPRLHNFSDALAIVGFSSKPNVVQNFDTVRAALRNDQAQVAVGPSLVKVSNNLYTLNQLLQQLLTEVQAITVPVTSAPGVSGTPVNAAAIAATATKIGQLLE